MSKLYQQKPLSPSSLKTFMKCPRQWYYKTIGTPEEFTGSQLILGKALHSSIEYFYTNANRDPLAAIDFFKDNYVTEKKNIEDKGKKIVYSSSNPKKDLIEGEGMLESFFKDYAGIKVAAVECSLLGEVELDLGPVLCYAGIDLIIEEDDGYKIADVKSGKSAPTDMYMQQDLQLSQYAYLFDNGRYVIPSANRQTFHPTIIDIDKNKPLKSKLILNIRGALKQAFTSHTVEFESDQIHHDIFVNTLNSIVHEMELYEKLNYYPKKGIGSVHSHECRYCPYQTICKKDK